MPSPTENENKPAAPGGRAPGIHDRAILTAMMVLAGLLPFAVVFSHRAVAPILLAMGLAVASRAEIWRAGVPYFLLKPDLSLPLVRLGLFFVFFCVWAALSGIWAPRADGPLLAFYVMTPALAGGAVVWETSRLSSSALSRLSRVLVWAGVAALGLLVVEAATGGALRALAPPGDASPGRSNDWTELARGATVMTMLSFGLLRLLWLAASSRALVALVYAGLLAAALRFGVFSNVAALMLGGGVFLIAMAAPRRTIVMLGAGFVAAMLLAPLAAFIPLERVYADLGGALPASWLHRVAIWRLAGEEAVACLPFGCGLDYARAIRDMGLRIDVPGAPAPLSWMPVHPHNLFLQVWLEMGLVGAAAFCGMIASGVQALLAARLSRADKAAITATAGAFLVSALVEASLWQVWRLAVLGLAGLYIAAAARRRALRAL